jgi:hypothetical protein
MARALCGVGLVALLLYLAAGPASAQPAPAQPAPAQDVGQVKVTNGPTHIERAGVKVPLQVGARILEGDVLVTGPGASLGIAFRDNSLLSLGPDTVLAIDRFVFDPTSHQGMFESSLRRGTLAAVSGKIAKQTPDAMKVRTPVAILGVRGTEFVARTVSLLD